MVVGRRDLDHVDARDRQLAADPADGVQQVARGEAARLGRARAGRVPRVADVDVDGQEDRVAVVERDLEGLVEAGVQPALHDLGHLVGAHVLLGHPAQGLGARPVAAQPHLQEPVAAQRARLDQAAHRLAVAVERAELDVAGVGVRVEVDHRDPAEAEVPGDAGGVGPGDRVVAAEHQRDGAGRRHGVDRLLERRVGHLDLPRRHLDVAGVDDAQVLERVDAQRQVRPGAVVGEVVGAAHGRRSEAGAGPVRGARVERRPDDDHVGVGVRRRLVEIGGGHAEEGDVRAELGAVPRHDRPSLSRDSPTSATGPASRDLSARRPANSVVLAYDCCGSACALLAETRRWADTSQGGRHP